MAEARPRSGRKLKSVSSRSSTAGNDLNTFYAAPVSHTSTKSSPETIRPAALRSSNVGVTLHFQLRRRYDVEFRNTREQEKRSLLNVDEKLPYIFYRLVPRRPPALR